jgi:DNA-binding PadR family transcriptional regulator
VALCASDGLITTRVDDNRVSNVWIITRDGLELLEELLEALEYQIDAPD